MKIKVFVLFCFLNLFSLVSQNEIRHNNFLVSGDVFGSRVFIENKGQFDNDLPGKNKILAVLDNGTEKIYFTDKGLVYKVQKKESLTEEQREAEERGEKTGVKSDLTSYVQMEWEHMNRQVSIEKKEKQSYYYTYGAAEYNSTTFKKLLYKNIYPNIDVEYSLPENKTCGIKYTLLLHPGASPRDIKINYKGDVVSVRKDKKGSVKIKTTNDEIIEYAPRSFLIDGGEPVKSELEVQHKIIGFRFPDGYDSTKALMIDPYVVAVSSLTSTVWSNNQAFDVDYDFNGNAYIFGGSPGYKVARYSSTGVLQWVFSGTLVVPFWSTNPSGNYEGNFLVDKATGKTYVAQGINTTNNQVIRLDASGNYDNFITVVNTQFTEVWDMGFRCSTNEVIAFGGCVPSNVSAGIIDQTTGTLSMANFNPTVATGSQDIVSHAIDDAGNFFVNYASIASPVLNNKISAINSTFNGNVWTQPSTFTTLVEAGNKANYVSYAGNGSNGFNSLAVNANYLFYYDGLNLAAYNKTTGTLTASTTVPGQFVKHQGGIAVDDCDNLYLGGNGFILTYRFTGTVFNQLTSIPLNTGIANPYAFDLKMDKVNKLIYVCGNSFVGTFSAVNSLTCTVASTPCVANIGVQNYSVCKGAGVNILVPNSGGLINPTYSILPGAITNTTGIFPVTPTITSSYTLFVTGTNIYNTVQTSSAVSTVTVYSNPILSPTVTQASCNNTSNAFNLGLSFDMSGSAPAYSVNWQPSIPPGINNATQTVANGGIVPGTYTATIVSAGNCSASALIVINPVPPVLTFSILNQSGTSTISCITPSVVLTTTTSYTPGVLSYSWSAGTFSSSAQSITVTSPGGLYTVQLKDVINNCVSIQTVVIGSNINLTVTALNSSPACKGGTVQLSAVSASASLIWSGPSGFTSNLPNPTLNTIGLSSGGIYTVTARYGVCTAQATTAVFVANYFPVTVTGMHTVCVGQALSFTASPSISYLWSGPNNFNSTIQNPLIQNASVSASGIYNLYANSLGTYSVPSLPSGTMICPSSFTTQAIVNPIPVIATSNVSACVNQSFQLNAYGGSSYIWTGPANFSSIIQNPLFPVAQTSLAGIYTVNVSNGINCSAQSYATVYVNEAPDKPLIVSNSPLCLKTDLVLSVSPHPGVRYDWSGPDYYTGSGSSATLTVGSLSKAGTYYVTVTNTSNCSATAQVDVIVFDLPGVNVYADSRGCGVLCTTFSLQTQTSNTLEAWYFNGVKETNLSRNLNKCFERPGSYDIGVKVKDMNGCFNTAQKKIDVFPKPIADFSFSPERPVSGTDELVMFKDASTGEAITHWDWYFWSRGQPNATDKNPSFIYPKPGTYLVTLVVKNQFECSDSVSKPLVVMEEFNFYVPNAFSPNNDGKNDVFMPKGANISSYELSIYDRWGHKVFHSTDIERGWEGKTGDGLDDFYPQGIYIWKINVTGLNKETKELNGHVLLIH